MQDIRRTSQQANATSWNVILTLTNRIVFAFAMMVTKKITLLDSASHAPKILMVPMVLAYAMTAIKRTIQTDNVSLVLQIHLGRMALAGVIQDIRKITLRGNVNHLLSNQNGLPSL